MTIDIKDLEALKQGHERVSTAASALIAALASVTDTPAPAADAPTAPFQVGDLIEYRSGLSRNIGVEGLQRIVSRVKPGGGLELADPVEPTIAVTGFYGGIAPYRVRKVDAPSPKFNVGDRIHVRNFMWDRPEGLVVTEVRSGLRAGDSRVWYRAHRGDPDRIGAFPENEVWSVDIPTLWGYKVGDKVQYTVEGQGLKGLVRYVIQVNLTSKELVLSDTPNGYRVGSATDWRQIEQA